ncbi:hypothetical protein RRG08_024154 [Elysia crispata]|uniref:TIR domain-containing protein n=1 Tax=Elysia crispata TaxID=231223 RepID=A0AAE0YPZ3_9GAST|nr:hypothetical protein RRG08_024154 [Elysia crispata]
MRTSIPNLFILFVKVFFIYLGVTLPTCTAIPQEEYVTDYPRRIGYHDEYHGESFETPRYSAYKKALWSYSQSVERDENIQSGPDRKTCVACKVIDSVYVNCSARNWLIVPTEEFPTVIQVFDLSRNLITALPGHAFFRYQLLRELNLERNNLCKIDPQAFAGLSNLKELNLFANKLVMNETIIRNAFSENVFAPLKNLRKLRLERNNPLPNKSKLRYPHRALSRLSSLEELCLDGFPGAVFESGFANLTLLKNLSLDGYKFGNCKLFELKNETFRHVTSVKYLSITDCSLQGHRIEAGTFKPLINLVSLNISFNQDINVQFFDRVFYGLQNTTTLKALHMQFVVNLYTLGVCLSSRYIKYFPQSIEYLDIRENKLQCVDRNVMDHIQNLKVLDISKNSFVFGTYLLDLPKLIHLTALHVDDYQFAANRLPKIYPFNPRTPPLETDNCSLYEKHEVNHETQELILRLPPKLHAMNVRYASMRYIFSQLKVDVNNSLESLVLEGNYFPVLEGPILGLNMIKNCHLVANKIYFISEIFFETFTSLQKLNLSVNRLGEFLEDYPQTKVFQPLVELISLDLASNTLRFLGKNLFHGLDKLQFLRISHNPIYRFFPDISNMLNLQAFIAVDTSLSYLSVKTRDAISRRVQNGSSFQADLEQSPIFCNCLNFPFIKWMVTSQAFNFTNKTYLCHYSDTSYINVHDGYTHVLIMLSRECRSQEDLFLTVGAITIVFILLLIFALAYRYRWKLRYMYHAAYIYLRSDRGSSDHRFEYDVFVCYAEENRRFVTDILCHALEERGLSVLVHHRHFTAGELIGVNIVRAVNTCRRTVVVLTSSLADSSWCNYEIQMANQETASRGKPVLIFLLFDDMDVGQLSPELLYNVQNNTYIQFPSCPTSIEDACCLKSQWDKLARDIRN